MTISISKQSNTLMINLPVQFGFKQQALFRQAYENNLDKSTKRIVINFLHTHSIDSAGLGMMLVFREYIEKNTSIDKNTIELSNCQQEIKYLLTAANFSGLFAVSL